jgi:hypothetical protein
MPKSAGELLDQYTRLWWASDAGVPPLTRTYTPREQSAREPHLQRFVDGLLAELRDPPRTIEQRAAAQQRVTVAFDRLARAALDLEERHLAAMDVACFVDVAAEFAQAARRFDATLTDDDILQAGRNLMTANGLQRLFDLPVRLTPALTAYSLLYPYTDNYLDDPAIRATTKRAFNARFRQRLSGERIAPANPHESRIFELIGMIEGQFARERYVQVYESLLAIHHAQGRSLELHRRRQAAPCDVDVLGISFDKGGTSVLADGCLAAGALDDARREFAFGLGIFAQLVDDLEDVREDCRAGRLTLFSQTAGRWPLDSVSNRTLQFGAQVLASLDDFVPPGLRPCGELIGRGVALVFAGLAGRAGSWYSRAYLRELEAHTPFRLAFINRQFARVARLRVSPIRLLTGGAFQRFGEPELAAIASHV